MVGTACAYVQDYTRAKMAASRMYELIDRKSEIDSGSEEGEKPVSPFWNNTTLSFNYFITFTVFCEKVYNYDMLLQF